MDDYIENTYFKYIQNILTQRYRKKSKQLWLTLYLYDKRIFIV